MYLLATPVHSFPTVSNAKFLRPFIILRTQAENQQLDWSRRKGFSHILTIIDRITRWPEVIPLSNTSTTECARALIRHWISRFGTPFDMSSDRGSQLTSTLWNEIAHQLGVNLHHTTAYHPQSNGLVERFHRTLKAALKARLQGPSWTDELPWVLLGLRTVPKDGIGSSAAELVYGTPLTVPGQFIDPASKCQPMSASNDSFSSTVKKLSPLPISHHSISPSAAISQSLRDAQFVFIRQDGHRGPLQRPYEGPYRVVASGEKTLRIMVGSREEIISADRLKPAHVDLTGHVSVAQPPRRGRPPLQLPEPTTLDLQTRSTRLGRTIRLPPRFQ
ncbi:hypothetical protein RRG08_035102 [Elysia crispata]|uniref:Integrase catalytic domain-containing protein n=1 Tax=Elysia crispata TaxID=231223 RepID=A0AAE1DLX8_9GAST|nr:hypothetical protein RRG08_035102 [Elysia crispata]